MQPLKPEEVQAILENSPAADAPGLIQEYEQLLADRFTEDPDAGPVADPNALEDDFGLASREQRLRELHDKLFSFQKGRENENTQER